MNRWLAATRSLMRGLAQVGMVALALLTLADVLGRYVFDVPIVGAVELTEFLMVGVIFAGIVLATASREHVTVDLLMQGLGPRGRRIQQAVGQSLATGISLLLAAATWRQAQSALEYQDRTQMIGLPMAPVIFFMSAMLLLNALVHAWQLWSVLAGRDDTHD